MAREASARTFMDSLIAGPKSLAYGLYEPVALRLARARFESLYRDAAETPLVTVYIPTYNRGEILMQRAVPSVLAQTYRNIELLIIGDRCTDATGKLLSGVNDPRLRFYNLKERRYRYPPTAENHWLAGPVVAANAALGLARGKWIARVDDDDTWTPDHVETLLRAAQKGGHEFVSAQYTEERYGKRRIMDGNFAQGSYYTRSDRPARGYNPKIGGTSTWLYRSYLRLFRYNIDCWRKKWNRVNDIDISVRMFRAGVRMGFVDSPLAYVLPRPGEETIGSEAYLVGAEEKIKHYEFK